MDARSLRVLEFPKILQLLADQAATSMGKQRALQLKPSTDEQWIRRRLQETSQARELLAQVGFPPLGGVSDIRALLDRARAGRGLEAGELLEVAAVLEACGRLRSYYAEGAQQAPMLYRLASRLGDYRHLAEAIRACIDDDGQVKPEASRELEQLHHRARGLQAQMHQRMQALLARYAERNVLQDGVIVQREGRWCLPVQVSQQSRFRGIVHDRSDSGATVFMEPLEVVELGNAIREAELAIEAERRRILRELSRQVGEVAEAVADDLRSIGVLDFITAKARLAQRMGAVEPEIADRSGYINLNGARHPLLRGEVVPISLWLGRDFTTLVITGPNTGGKTVTLKTVGLLVLMGQAGLHVPAEPGTVISVFDGVYADIGDEQSIEQSLSTFSSHMTQIVKIISRVRQAAGRQGGKVNALVLLDEIGAGTDPAEGAALARAILRELHDAGCRTIATTHYNDLKMFAYSQPGMENASVAFDIKTLQPLYRVLIGHPGASNAFEIAQRLGLPRRLVEESRQFMDEEEQTFTQVLAQMEEHRRRLEKEQRATVRAQRDAEELREEYQKSLEELRKRQRQLLEEGYAEAKRIVREAQEQARAIIADLQRQERHTQVAEQRREELKQLDERIEARFARQRQQIEPPPTPPPPAAGDVAPGTRVHVPAWGRDGLVTEILDEETAEVQIGNLRVEVNITDLQPAREQPQVRAAETAARMKMRKQMAVGPEIDLRGSTVDEAILQLEKYLDDAMLAGMSSVRIVHGKGTGALREGIHHYLRRHRHVADFHFAPFEEGGDGVTVVTLG